MECLRVEHREEVIGMVGRIPGQEYERVLIFFRINSHYGIGMSI